jgi:transcriptional regulator with XRE-family HTH domain
MEHVCEIDFVNSVKTRIKYMLKLRKMSNVQLVELTGIPRSTLLRGLKNGTNDLLSITNLLSISKALNVPFYILFIETEFHDSHSLDALSSVPPHHLPLIGQFHAALMGRPP